MAYIASVQTASGVQSAIKAKFLDPEEECLIVAKSNRAEIYEFDSSGLALRSSFTVYGVITGLLSIRPERCTTDHLFISTDRHDYFTVSWDSDLDTPKTENAFSDVSDQFSRDARAGPKYISDPEYRMVALNVYEGQLIVVPLVRSEKKGPRRRSAATTPEADIGNLGEPSLMRMKEILVIDMVFLYATDVPILAVLHRDGKPDFAKLATYKIVKGGHSYELQEWELRSLSLEAEAKMLIPVPKPSGGVLVLGEQTIIYLPLPGGEKPIKRPLGEQTVFLVWGMVDSQSYLLGDENGTLKYLFLKMDNDKNVIDIIVETLGPITYASTVVYLDNGHAFVGSQHGDSQLVKLHNENPRCRVVQSFPGLAPILDFKVIGANNPNAENEKFQYAAGQTKIIACCGGFVTGSLRSLRSGVGLKDTAIIGDIIDARGLWTLKSYPNSQFDDVIVVSFINETRIFLFDSDGDVEELDNFKCFNLKEETLTAVCLSGGRFLQVTTSRLIIVDAEAGTVVSQRSTPNKVTAASANDDVLVCNIGYKTIIIYDLKHELMMVSKRFFDNEVSCIYATPDFPDLCVVGFWNIATIQLLSLPSLENISEESLSMGTDELAIPRSIIIAKILKNQDPFLLVAMGDGILYTFSMNPAKKYLLSQKKAIALESQSFYFQAMAGEDDTVSVFAACDQPSFIYAVDGQIRYCAFTTEKVRLLAPFNNQAFPSSVVNIANGELKISLIDTTRSIHIKKLPVGEVIRRIAYSNEKQIYGIITVRSSIDIYTGGETYISNVRLVSGVELSIVESYELLKHELVESILCARLDNGDGTWSEKFIVGTGFQPNHRGESNPTNGDGAGDECKEGRLLVFEVSEDRKFKIAAELKIHGSVKALDMMDDKIVTACNKTVEIYAFGFPTTPTKPEITQLATYHCHSEPIDLGVSGKRITVGDLMKGPYLLEYTEEPSGTHNIKELCRTYQTIWTTAVAMMDGKTVINADAEGNLSIWQHDDSVPGVDNGRLQMIGELKIGEMVNCIRPVQDLPQKKPASAAVSVNKKSPVITPVAYAATVRGSIYIIGRISESHIKLLLQLQTNLAKVVSSIGGLDFNQWRSFSTPTRPNEREPYRFVDGDFIERFLELPLDLAEEVVKGGESGVYALGANLDEVRRLVEGLKSLY